MGCKTIRTPELIATILERIMLGVPLAVILRDDGMPHQTTWSDWVRADEGNDDIPAMENLAIAYARAREIGFDAIAAECLDIADETSHDTKMVGRDGDKREAPDNEWISRSKLRVETRLKLLAKWDPKRYGDRLDLTSSDKSMTPRTLADFYKTNPDAPKPDDAAE